MDSIRVGELEIAYRRAGAGPPLVLLHGAATDGRSWTPQLTGLADSFDVIAWDEPGAGGSSDPPDDTDLAGYAELLASFLGGLGFGRVHLGGLSWGGVLAQEVCLRHPDLVGSLILADTYAGWKGSLPAAECRHRVELALAYASAPPSGDAPAMPGLFGPDASRESVDWLAEIASETRATTARRVATLLADCDLRDRQGEIRAPCLLVWGELDERSPLEVGESHRERIADSRLIVFAGAGHMTNLERPDEFNDALRDFCLPIAL
jgi:pimeloyl-ACP methyl ester carboxylesterase